MILINGNLYSFDAIGGHYTGIFEEVDPSLRLIKFRKVTRLMTYKPEVEWQETFETKHVPSYELADAQEKVRKEMIEPLKAAGADAEIPAQFIVYNEIILNMDNISEYRPMKNYFEYQ